MPKHQMLINVVAGEECRIAITADGRLEELYQERASAESHVGNIYKGRVTNVEPSIQAAFIDFGQARNGFLHISDLHPMYFAGHDKDETELVGQKTPRRDRPPIQKCLRRGQEILVQVLKEGIGTKGPTLTSYLSIPGRYLVMMPSMERLGVSRKVEDDDARREMRRILDELNPPSGFGFIIRTAGIGKTKTELKRDLAYLQRLWSSIEQRKKRVNVGELFAESDLVVRTIRDIFSTDIEQIIVDDETAAKRARDFLAIANPRTSSQVALYNDPIPLFHRFDIETQIENISARTVPLPSGGSLVIDSTEALVAIDVNSGKMRDGRDAEATAFKANMEAADEICRQLRLRDLGGVIVNDLIDMRDPRHRKQVESRFRDNLKRDRARTRTSPISQFGILEMTRQRMRPSLRKSIYIDCPHCQGAAQVKSPESVVLDVMRRLALVMHRSNVAKVELTVGPAVAFTLLNRKRAQLVAIEGRHGKTIMVRVNDSGPSDFVSLLAYDERGSQVEGESLANMGKYQLLPVEAVKGKAVIQRDDEDEEEASQKPAGKGKQDAKAGEPETVFEIEMDDETDAPDDEAQAEDASDESAEQSFDEQDDSQQQGSDEASQSGDDSGEPGSGKKRRRRRRRGGKGRKKRGEGQQSDQQHAGDSAAGEDSSEDAHAQGDEGRSDADRDAGDAHAQRQREDRDDRVERDNDTSRDEAADDDSDDHDQSDSQGQQHNGDDSGKPGGRKRRRRRRGGRRSGNKASSNTEASGESRADGNASRSNDGRASHSGQTSASSENLDNASQREPREQRDAQPKPAGPVSKGYHNPAVKPVENGSAS